MSYRTRATLTTLAPLLLLLLAACGGPTELTPLACPTPGLLGEGADLARHRPGPVRDLTTLDHEARLAGLSGSCRPGRRGGAIEMSLSPAFTIERGPAAQGRFVDLPWFVAVLDGRTDTILAREAFTERVAFERNETRLTAAARPVTLTLPVAEGRSIQDLRILVSFQLTPEELERNRRRAGR